MLVQPEFQSPLPVADRLDAAPAPRQLCVLVVTDQQLWISSLDSVLGERGFVVVPASTAAQALEQIDAAMPDVVIVHSSLGDVSGLDLCRTLRDTGRIDAATPLIMTTAGPCTREVRLRALEAGAWDCHGFPPDPELLLLKVEVYSRAKLHARESATGG